MHLSKSATFADFLASSWLKWAGYRRNLLSMRLFDEAFPDGTKKFQDSKIP